MDSKRKYELAKFMLSYLTDEASTHGSLLIDNAANILKDDHASFGDIWNAVRAMLNVRPPWEAAPEFLVAQDELLPSMIEEAGIHTIGDAKRCLDESRMFLWRGDITTLCVDAIVNAANSGMTGCWQPLHYCIDNAIHTFAGVQLRAEMAQIMAAQGHEEPTAHAKITSAYNLPSKHIIHTVGPIANGAPTENQRAELAQCYEACLDIAYDHKCLSIAFCCISTGVFGFPQRDAAKIAVNTVRNWVKTHPSILVIFNVFGEVDEAIYRDLLGLE